MSTDQRLNILLVDDQPSKLLTYETILSGLGENLLKATSASEALDRLLKHEIAVVLVDVCMPDLDGYALAAMIREHPRYQRTAIIFVSAILMTDLDRLRGYECGAVDYVPVPVVPEILRAKVSVFADLYRKTRQLERLNSELEERVKMRTAELEASAVRLRENEERLREADRRKDEFLAMLAHELRNPLAPIWTAIQLLRLRDLPAAQQTRAREIVEHQVKHMVRLIDDLLDVCRISRGMIAVRRDRVDLNVIVARALETVRPLLEERRHEFCVELPERLVALNGDETRLAQVVANLVNNAAKYTDPGGRIVLRVSESEGEVAITVRDTGIGIAADDLGRVFDLFTQVEHEPGRLRSGLGIGLALVRRLVDLHGGSVSVQSDGRGCGSEFVVRLPALTSDRVRTPPAEPAADVLPQARSPRRILVVDDNTEAAEAIAMLLEAAGHAVRVANTGREALEIVEAFQPDTVLLDLGMPELDGFETAARLRQLPSGDKLLVVALTGWGQQKDRERTREAGFDAHLVKPVFESDLLAILNQPPATSSAEAAS